MKKIRTLLLGLGRIASLLEKDELRYHPCTHSGILLRSTLSERFDLAAAYDPNRDRVTEFLQDWNLNIASNLSEIKPGHYDLCVIASSSEAHFENFRFAASLGINRILIEKPVCIHYNDLLKLKRMAESKQISVWVNHERRYHPAYNYARDLLLSGNAGEIKTVRAAVLTSYKDPGRAFKTQSGGPLLHDGTHALDFLDFLLGKVKKVHFQRIERQRRNYPEKRALAVIEYANGVFSFLEAGGERNYFQFEIDIETTEKRIILSNDGHKIYNTTESPLYKGFKSLREESFPQFENMNPWIFLYQEIIDHFDGKSNQIKGSLSANQRILKLINLLYS